MTKKFAITVQFEIDVEDVGPEPDWDDESFTLRVAWWDWQDAQDAALNSALDKLEAECKKIEGFVELKEWSVESGYV